MKKEFSKAIKLIMQIADETNKYINEHTPWKLDKNEAAIIATTALNALKFMHIVVASNTNKKMLSMLTLIVWR